MRVLYDICDILEDELEDIVKSGEMTPKDLEIVDKSVDVIKDIKTIKAMEDASWDNGMSRDGGYSNRVYYDDGISMARGGRGRSMLRDGRGGYSRHDEKEMLEEKIDELKNQLNQMR